VVRRRGIAFKIFFAAKITELVSIYAGESSVGRPLQSPALGAMTVRKIRNLTIHFI
jgi:hypothetical protein